MELALRFVLLRKIAPENLPASGVPLGQFLTERMIDVVGEKKLDQRKEEKAFKDTFDLLDEALGSDCFRKYEKQAQRFTGGFSVAAFEVIALGIGWTYDKVIKHNQPADISKVIKNKVWADTSFLTSTGLAAAYLPGGSRR